VVAALVPVVVMVTFAACGRKADPRPPELAIPRSTDPVLLANVATGIKVTWKRPRSYVDGTALDDLGSFRILRACDAETAFAQVAMVSVNDRERFRKTASFTLVDHDVPIGSTCAYRVIAVTLDDYASAPADSSYLTRVELPAATPEATPVPGKTVRSSAP
jgi:hypothetical protein